MQELEFPPVLDRLLSELAAAWPPVEEFLGRERQNLYDPVRLAFRVEADYDWIGEGDDRGAQDPDGAVDRERGPPGRRALRARAARRPARGSCAALAKRAEWVLNPVYRQGAMVGP